MTDCHVHLYPPEADADPAAWAAARGEKHWALLCTRRRKDGRLVQTLPTLAELLHEMDAANVDRAILLGWYWEHHATCEQQNRFYAECVRQHPDRLSAFATLHPQVGTAALLDELKRTKDAGLVGVGELSPHSQGYGIDDPAFSAMLDLAADLGMPVNLHVTDPDSARYPGWIATPLGDFVTLAEKHPRTRFILAHWGGLLPCRDERARGLTNLFYDTAASPLLYDETVWKKFLAVVPKERVFFGSDYPLNVYPRLDAQPSMSRMIAEAHRSGLGATELAAIMRDNARALFSAARAPT